MIAIWPEELPDRFLRDGFQGGLGDGRLRSKTATGPGKTRLRSRAVVDPMPGSMQMSGAQLRRFLAFYHDEIGEGSEPFVFPDPMEGLPVLVQFGDDLPGWKNLAGDLWGVTLPLGRIRTGSFEPGLPALPAGFAFVTSGGAYVLANRKPVIVRVQP